MINFQLQLAYIIDIKYAIKDEWVQILQKVEIFIEAPVRIRDDEQRFGKVLSNPYDSKPKRSKGLVGADTKITDRRTFR